MSPALSLSYIPNVLTVIRLLLVIPVALALWWRAYQLAFVLFIVAGLSDGLDGFLARRFNWHSRFGAMVDPLADKLLLVVTYIMLTLTGIIPWWLMAVILGRDLIIVSGAVAYHHLVGPYEFKPTLLGKLSTFCQIILAVLLIINLALIVSIPVWLVDGLMLLTLTVTILSGADYVWVWGRQYLRERAKV
ncbi:CDP-alcohol phosphatidyltransferase family protein [Spartinivicinus poritis]|uniref:CDP-diacylglycerol--glycerol-3-phosphate 3-phosphatidyltransferase n=1 Tax=Spartinivicinus poritis TaxID=2994640 RepID=A0ABT5U7M7_9GAMM|nr:CDP-alcohol phosphatidyltransferase family protein [Spartinivicinus sp. A2-2]MDE1462383.1 CDP-alcohol phosphatidyltransferase family protein [Spartinivicinus sp. A2-2]